VRTLHVGIRVADIDRSLVFYTALGYAVVGRVPDAPIGALVMLKLPGDEFVALELVQDPTRAGEPTTGLSHLVIQVESMSQTVADLSARGVDVEAPSTPDGSTDFLTATVSDPDGNKVELVQWPPGHPTGMTAADFAT
jgi:lactoylglutathione lyase